MNFLALFNDRTLVDACTLVGSLELYKLIAVCCACAFLDNNFIGGNTLNNTVMLGNYAYSRVNSRLVFHTCADDRSFCFKQRNCLTLHVRTHEGSVSIIVFEERDHCRSDGNNHLRRYVHKVDALSFALKDLVTVSCINLGTCKLVILGKRFISLCNSVVILDISCHINNFVGNNACFLINTSVRSFDKSVFVDSCK